MIIDLLPLDRPLIALDLETTGLYPGIDKICQLGIVKAYPDGTINEFEALINPGIPIPPDASESHHITDEMVKDEPTFGDLAPMLIKGFVGCDILGYNSDNFDIRFLIAEFQREGIDFKPGKTVDSYKIYRKNNPHNLANAYRYYTGKEHENAHSAIHDARATFEIFRAQLLRHEDLPRNIADIHSLYLPKAKDDKKFLERNGRMIFLFGRYLGKSLDDADIPYLHWILRDKNFSEETKIIVRNYLHERTAASGN